MAKNTIFICPGGVKKGVKAFLTELINLLSPTAKNLRQGF